MLSDLIADMDAIVDSEENRHKLDRWRSYRACVPSNEAPGGPMITMDIGIPTYARICGFDVRQFYSDTLTQLCCSLKMRLWHHEHLADDTAFGRGLGVNPLGCVLEPSMLGVPVGLPPDMEPWALHDHTVVEDDADIASLPMPDFSQGYMPQACRMYGEAIDILHSIDADHWPVHFPGAIRGVLGLAQAMRGPHQNIIMDMLFRPTFAHSLYQYVTDFHCAYWKESARFTGKPIPLGHIGNDEVNVPLVSPTLYEEFLLPYETQISKFHGGLSCWHSCGTTTPLLDLIRRVPNVHQFYTGPWTDVDEVMRVFGADTPIMIAVNTVDDVMAADAAHMRDKVSDLTQRCEGAALQIRGGAMNSAFDLEHDVDQMIRWTHIVREQVTAN